MSRQERPSNPIVVYGTTWCMDCTRAKRILQQRALPFEWVDIEADEAGWLFVAQTNRGMMSVPVLRFPDESLLVEPSNAQLIGKLQSLYVR